MSFLPDSEQRIKKNSKKKLKNTIIATFLAKISEERPRKREKKKKNRSDEFLPEPEQRIPKKQPKNSKN